MDREREMEVDMGTELCRWFKEKRFGSQGKYRENIEFGAWRERERERLLPGIRLNYSFHPPRRVVIVV